MNSLLIGLLGALLATNQPVAVSNLVNQTTGISVKIPDPNDPVEQELKKIMEEDDVATAEVDKWIRENDEFAKKGGGERPDQLASRVRQRLESVKKSYQDFLQRHPDHARAHLAFGSFLMDTRDEDGAVAEWEKARELDPKNPAAWNNLAEVYAHHGPLLKAFDYYTKAIELNPTEPLYYHNFGTVVYLFRKDAMEYYKINEQQVFDKALELYSQAMKYDPENFELAQDVAQTYYGIKPFRTEAALTAWTNTLKLATTEIQKEGVYIHLARVKLHAERFAEARQHLTAVTNEIYDALKTRVMRNLDLQEAEAKAKAKLTNAPPKTEATTGK